MGTPAEAIVGGHERMAWIAEDWCGNEIGVEESGWIKCPYGSPGDRLWVRETWFSSTPKTPSRVRYAADDLIRLEDGLFARAVCKPPKWRPSIFMPRWASRITLEIVAVRVERLQDISDADAIREGIPDYPDFTGDSPVHDYSALWESINGRGSWISNPFVWVIEFTRVNTKRSGGGQ